MELQEKMYNLSERIKQLKENIQTEEATKQSFILPFFQALGYDVFNPLEFIPEFTADVGIKKHEKVDYAILQEGKPLILIEAKSCNEKLDKHDSQFYSDLDQPNVMDSQPFYVLDMMDLSDQAIQYLANFNKCNLDIDSIMNTASDLKYLSLTKTAFKELIENPTDEFIKLLLNSV